MTIEHDPVGESSDSSTDDTTRVVRASSVPPRPTPSAPPPAGQQRPFVVTAEIPTYRPTHAPAPGAPSRYAAPRPPGRARRREPAPMPLQILVWVIALVCLIALVTLVTAKVHPSWLSFLRNTSTSVGAPASPAADSTTAGRLTLVSTTSSKVTYRVPASRFSIVVTPVAEAFLTVKSPPSASAFVYAHVVKGPHNPATVPVTASAEVKVAAATTSIEITSEGTVLGQVTSPKLGVTYLFESSNS